MDDGKEIIKRVLSDQNDNVVTSVQRKLNTYLIELDKWNKARLGGSLRGTIRRKEDEIRELSLLKSGNWKDCSWRVERELEKLLEEEEIYWKQRSKEE